eukprot:CAMPEP_0168329708 /NCGR_PEP_ID=MMETSP0213-20121227/7272_1 /TAXON_ID=151035 /ORGANISM="Euplotes harpa, Strain FSP1.4" /LENGTH=175 /DNA_ID=CAMNT_0008333091 /DNA_START=277 /DNA_END=804 /DNA_ORIENTATION=+
MDLDKYIEVATSKSKLFPAIQDIGYLIKPCRVIILPLLTSMILMGWELPKAKSYNFADRGQIKSIWLIFRIHIRNKNYLKYIKSFNLDGVTSGQIQLVKKILAPHNDMNFAIIVKECKASAFMFEWTRRVLEYHEIKQSLTVLGVKEIEDKITHYNKISKKMVAVFDRILANQEF